MQAVSGSSQAALPSSTGGEVSFVQSELWVHLVGTFLALRSSGGRLTPPVRWVGRQRCIQFSANGFASPSCPLVSGQLVHILALSLEALRCVPQRLWV